MTTVTRKVVTATAPRCFSRCWAPCGNRKLSNSYSNCVTGVRERTFVIGNDTLEGGLQKNRAQNYLDESFGVELRTFNPTNSYINVIR